MINFSFINQKGKQGGYIVLLNTLIFVAISTFVVYALAAPLISSNRAATAIVHSKRAFIVANSAAEETLYKMKAGMTVPSFSTLTLGDVSADVSVSTDFGGRTVQITGIDADVERELQISVSESVGVSFNYGLQTGLGGFDLYGGALVNGNIYSNGDVLGFGGAEVTGSVTVANASAPVADQSNGGVSEPTNEITFGGQLVWNELEPEFVAQSFQVSTTTSVSSVRIYVKKYSSGDWMGDATMRIKNNSGSKPGNTTYASATLSAAQVTTSFNHITLPLSSTPSLTPGTTYWIVFEPNYDWGNYFILGANQNGYGSGVAKVKEKDSSTWIDTTPSGLDIFFDIYVGGQTGSISGQQNDRLTIGNDAWAHTVSGVDAGGTLYCQTSSYTNKACDTSRPDAVQQPFPISDGNIEAWKQEAEQGGVQSGDVTIGPWPDDHVTMGVTKIEGDLTVTAGGSLTLEGTLWVTGDLTVNGGADVILSENYGSNSGIIVADGRVTATGGGTFAGNGTPGNYILVITTSTCPVGSCGGNPAITLSGGAGSVILNAQKGTLEMTGGAEAKQLTADRIIMNGGTEVYYETGLMDMSFDSGPSGSWSVSEWSEQ